MSDKRHGGEGKREVMVEERERRDGCFDACFLRLVYAGINEE